MEMISEKTAEYIGLSNLTKSKIDVYSNGVHNSFSSIQFNSNSFVKNCNSIQFNSLIVFPKL